MVSPSILPIQKGKERIRLDTLLGVFKLQFI